MASSHLRTKQKVIGLIPAAGLAKRLQPLPCSKEIYPVGIQNGVEEGEVRPKVAAQYLLENMREAGVDDIFIIIRDGKWDIPSYFGDGYNLGLNLGYLMMRRPYGTPYTLDQAYPFVKDALIVTGFPDIIFTPQDALAQLLGQHFRTQADIVLGLFLASNPQKVDMVAFDEDGWVESIVIKPQQSTLSYCWITAVWTPAFTEFLHTYLETHDPQDQPELYVGHVIQAAIDSGMKANSVLFPTGTNIDIGTPDDLFRMRSSFLQ